MELYNLEISWRTLWRIFIFGLFVYVLFMSREALGALFVGVVISLGIDPLVGFFETRKINRLLGTVFVFLGGGVILAGVLYLTLPVLIKEAAGFLSDFNAAILSFLGISLPTSFVQGASETLSRVMGFLDANNIPITVAVSKILKEVVLTLSVVIISFYLSIERYGTERLLRVIIPDIYERPVLKVFSRFKIKIRRWLGAQLALSLILGVVVSAGLWILGVRYALVLGIIAAVFEVVPIIGPILAGTFAFMVAFSDSVNLGLYVILFFLIVQQLENHILVPIIMGKTMKVHPVIVIVSLLAGGQVAGFLGVLLAVPIAVASQEIFNYIAEQKDTRGGLGI